MSHVSYIWVIGSTRDLTHVACVQDKSHVSYGDIYMYVSYIWVIGSTIVIYTYEYIFNTLLPIHMNIYSTDCSLYIWIYIQHIALYRFKICSARDMTFYTLSYTWLWTHTHSNARKWSHHRAKCNDSNMRENKIKNNKNSAVMCWNCTRVTLFPRMSSLPRICRGMCQYIWGWIYWYVNIFRVYANIFRVTLFPTDVFIAKTLSRYVSM